MYTGWISATYLYFGQRSILLAPGWLVTMEDRPQPRVCGCQILDPMAAWLIGQVLSGGRMVRAIGRAIRSRRIGWWVSNLAYWLYQFGEMGSNAKDTRILDVLGLNPIVKQLPQHVWLLLRFGAPNPPLQESKNSLTQHDLGLSSWLVISSSDRLSPENILVANIRYGESNG